MNAKLLRAATIVSALSILGYLSLAPSRVQSDEGDTCGNGHGKENDQGFCVCEANFSFVDGVCKQIGGTGSGDGTGSVGNTGGGTGGDGNTGGGNVPGTTTPAGSGPGGPNTPVGTQDPPAKAEEGEGEEGGGGCCG